MNKWFDVVPADSEDDLPTPGSDANGEVHAPTAENPDPPVNTRSGGLADPVDYVVASCLNHQIVMLSDQRGVSQHLRFVADLVPELHRAGVNDLAWEFTNTRRQDDLDRLTTGPRWDRELCNDLFVDLMGVGHGYREYGEILEAVWRHNSRLGEDQEPFRVVALGLTSYVEDPDLLEGRSAADTELRDWWMGGHYPDITSRHMANVLTTEVIQRGRRALVYGDWERTSTRVVLWEEDIPFVSAGRLLRNWMAEGVKGLMLHGALADDFSLRKAEELIEASPDPEEVFGIDLDRSTLGDVRVHDIEGCTTGARNLLTLSDLADGYIHLVPRAAWEVAELTEDLLRPANLAEAERRHRALLPRDQPYSMEELEESRREGRRAMAASWPSLPPGRDVEPAAGGRPRSRRRFRRN